MPNHCESDLYISGPVDKIKEFVEFAKGKDPNFDEGAELSAHSFIPYPKKYLDLDIAAEEWMKNNNNDWFHRPKDGFGSGGYDWCCDKWGTKWNFYSLKHKGGWKDLDKRKKGKGEISYTFQTAWSPPIPVIKAMAKRFPELTFDIRYFERGQTFSGQIVFENGKKTVDEFSKEYKGHRGG